MLTGASAQCIQLMSERRQKSGKVLRILRANDVASIAGHRRIFPVNIKSIEDASGSSRSAGGVAIQLRQIA